SSSWETQRSSGQPLKRLKYLNRLKSWRFARRLLKTPWRKHMAETLVFVGGKRTAFGANGGTVKDIGPTDLGIAAARAALSQSGLSGADVDHVISGNVLHSAPDSIYTPRHIGIGA